MTRRINLENFKIIMPQLTQKDTKYVPENGHDPGKGHEKGHDPHENDPGQTKVQRERVGTLIASQGAKVSNVSVA